MSQERKLMTRMRNMRQELTNTLGRLTEAVDIRIRFHKAAFERQIFESVLIQASRPHFLLNSKMEYNRYQIPRILIKMGEKEIVDRRREIGERIGDEKRKDQELQEKIKKLKKLINKKRASGDHRKRTKIDPSGLIGLEILGMSEKRDIIDKEKRTTRRNRKKETM